MRFRSFIFLLLTLLILSSFQKKMAFNGKNEIWFNSISANSHINWRATHFGGIVPRYGKIFLQKGQISLVEGRINYLSCVIDMNSILVENFKEKQNAISLAQHLKSSDFFNTEQYPTSTFRMTKIEVGNKKYTSKITGDLTILDSTNSITFFCNIQNSENAIELHSEKFKINRTRWGLNYHKEESKGMSPDTIISNSIEFEISLKMNR